MKIYVSPSSQTDNVGAGNYGTEADRMQQLSDYLVPKLKKAGYTVYGGDNSLSLSERVTASNNANVDLHIALHSNASKNGGARGAEALYYKDSTNSKKIAQLAIDKISAIAGAAPGRSPVASTFYEVKNTTAVATIIEVGFHDNEKDAKWIVNNLSNIATAIYNAIKAY